MDAFLKLVASPQVLALLGISGGIGGLIGWFWKSARSAAQSAAKNELELAIEALERAKRTPAADDDVAAQKHVDNVKRLKALVDALPEAK